MRKVIRRYQRTGVWQSGIAGAFVWLIASIPIGMALAPFQSSMAQEALRNTADLPPELRTMLEQFSGAPAIGIGMILAFFVMLVISTLFGMLGGLLSGWSWDAVGAGLTFTLSAAFALAGMIILWRGWPFGRQ